jgi:hypothetical protein
MKYLLLLAVLGIGGCHHWVTNSQVAAGEWKIEIQTPPCDSPKNLQVIWPKESGGPLTLECDLMPVAEK